MGLLSTKTHGILDCLLAFIFLATPRLLHFNTQLTFLMALLAVVIVSSSLMTRYEWGILRVIPTRLHLILDCYIGIALCFVPLFISISVLQSYLLIALGITLIFSALLTPSRSPREKKRFKNSLRRRKPHKAVAHTQIRH